MDKDEYAKGLALSILPDRYAYEFENIKVVSEMDENGELQIEVIGRTDVGTIEELKTFLNDFYDSSGASFNVKSGRADRKGKEAKLWGYRKCMMQVYQKKNSEPKTKGLHQDCKADLNFKLENPKNILPRDSEALKGRKI